MISSLFENVSPVYFVVLSIIVLMTLVSAGMLISYRRFSFMGNPLYDYLLCQVPADGYFADEIYECCVYYARKIMKSVHGVDETLFVNKTVSLIKPLFFRYDYEDGGSTFKMYFSHPFVEYMKSLCEDNADICVREFRHIVKSYVYHVYSERSVNRLSTDSFDKRLLSDVVSGVMSTDEALSLQEKIIDDAVNEAIPEQQAEVKERDDLFKRLVASSYNCAVRDVKLHNGGLDPVVPDKMRKSLFDKMHKFKVYTFKNIQEMTEEDLADLDTEGCYIIYNTFTRRYFIGRSDSMVSRIKTILQVGNVSSLTLKEDLNRGHIPLFKFVPLNNSGYSNIARLQRDLILSYACNEGKGYNK